MPKRKFLVIEDDLFYQTYVNDLLAGSGVDVVNAADGETGLAMAVQEQPDLIITDIEIPKIQGFVLFKALRERPETKETPVIMMSGKVEKALLERHSRMALHADGYLVKPFSGQVLIDMIRNVMGEDFGFSEVVIDEPGEGEAAATDPSPTSDIPADDLSSGTGPAAPDAEKGVTILVVDDSKYICDVTRDFLEELGVRTEIAFDGESGYRMASELLPDLVILDVQMPNMNGFVVCEALRKQESTKGVPIILMSAVVDDESFQRHSRLRYHADAYLQKPFMKSELHELVRRFTSLGDTAAKSVESKTGFFVPTEDSGHEEKTSTATQKQADTKVARELEEARVEIQQKAAREQQLITELEEAVKARDELEAEMHELRKTVQGDEDGLRGKLSLVTQKFEEYRELSERLSGENADLKAELEAGSDVPGDAQKISELEENIARLEADLEEKVQENQELQSLARDGEKIDELKAQLSEMGSRLQQASASVLDLENQNDLLKGEVAQLREVQERTGESAAEGERRKDELSREVDSLRRDLTAAIAAKQEIEDQASSLLESRPEPEELRKLREDLELSRKANEELDARLSEMLDTARETGEAQSQLEELRSKLEKQETQAAELRKQLEGSPGNSQAEVADINIKLDSALARAAELEKEKAELEKERSELAKTVGQAAEVQNRNAELKSLNEQLRRDDEESRKLAARETQTRMDLEGRLENAIEEKALLERELEKAGELLARSRDEDDQVNRLQERLQAQEELRAKADQEVEELKRTLDDLSGREEVIRALEKEIRELKAALEESRERLQGAEKERDLAARGGGREAPPGSGTDHHLDERLSKLEDALKRTVTEAQDILKERQDRETELEGTVEALMRSLEEERKAFRRDREEWSAREGELRGAFEEAIRESRRMMSEEAARLYPVHIPRHHRPLEFVSRTNRYGLAAAAVALALVVFSGGYLLRSRTGQPEGQTSVTAVTPTPVAEPAGPAGSVPEPFIVRSGPGDSYEELWRRNTVQSVSDDMMIQATLHTRDELQAAIQYTAAKEGWTRERTDKAMKDMAGTYDLSGSYYITVYSKNLKGGYPGYADQFEQHLALRDQSGREVRGHLPEALGGSKFITSRVSAAGKEMNPAFLYEVGLTVAFPRQGFAGRPEGLQLVLYDIGAVPVRVLTWDLSVLGSLS